MSSSMVRTGGIGILAIPVVMIVGGLLVGASAVDAAKAGKVASVGVGPIIINLITTLLFIFGYWATKVYTNSKGFHKSDAIIFAIIAALVILTLLGFVGGAGIGGMTNARAMNAGGAVGIISLVVTLLYMVLVLVFSIQLIGFGKQGGGIWKAVGILMLIATSCLILLVAIMIIAASAGSLGLLSLAGIFGLIGGLVALAGLIVWGIALIISAGKMGTA